MDCDKCFVLHVSYDLDLLHPLQAGPSCKQLMLTEWSTLIGRDCRDPALIGREL